MAEKDQLSNNKAYLALRDRLIMRFQMHISTVMILCEVAYRDSKYGLSTMNMVISQLKASSDEILNEVASFLAVAKPNRKLSDFKSKSKKDPSKTVLENLKANMYTLHQLLLREIQDGFIGTPSGGKSDDWRAKEDSEKRAREKKSSVEDFVQEFCDAMAGFGFGTKLKNAVSKEKKETPKQKCLSRMTQAFAEYMANISAYNQGLFRVQESYMAPLKDQWADTDKIRDEAIQPSAWRYAPVTLAAAMAEWIIVQ